MGSRGLWEGLPSQLDAGEARHVAFPGGGVRVYVEVHMTDNDRDYKCSEPGRAECGRGAETADPPWMRSVPQEEGERERERVALVARWRPTSKTLNGCSISC